MHTQSRSPNKRSSRRGAVAIEARTIYIHIYEPAGSLILIWLRRLPYYGFLYVDTGVHRAQAAGAVTIMYITTSIHGALLRFSRGTLIELMENGLVVLPWLWPAALDLLVIRR